MHLDEGHILIQTFSEDEVYSGNLSKQFIKGAET